MDRLSDEQISAILDGAATPALLQQVSRNPQLAAQVESARRFEVALHSALHRWDCPLPGRLGDYALDLLPQSERGGVARHLELCLHCREEIALLTEFLADEHTPPRVPTELPEPFLPPRWHEVQMQPSTLTGAEAWRGTGEGTSYVLEAQGLTLFIEHGEQSAHRKLNGQLVTEDPSAQGQWRGALAELRHDGNVTTTELDELGEFAFSTIQECELLSLRITNEAGLTVVWTRAAG